MTCFLSISNCLIFDICLYFVSQNDSLTESFTELKGEDRELKLAAAHVDDAITGRGKYGRARAFFKPSYGRW